MGETRSFGTSEYHYVQKGFYMDQIERFMKVFPDRYGTEIVCALQSTVAFLLSSIYVVKYLQKQAFDSDIREDTGQSSAGVRPDIRVSRGQVQLRADGSPTFVA